MTAAEYFFPSFRNSTPEAWSGDDPSWKTILETVAPVRTNRFSRFAFGAKYAYTCELATPAPIRMSELQHVHWQNSSW